MLYQTKLVAACLLVAMLLQAGQARADIVGITHTGNTMDSVTVHRVDKNFT